MLASLKDTGPRFRRTHMIFDTIIESVEKRVSKSVSLAYVNFFCLSRCNAEI